MLWDEFCASYRDRVRKLYKQRTGRVLNINNPALFTEKIQWLKLYDCSFQKALCADKYLLHAYANDVLGEDICIPLLGVFDSFEDIPFTELPGSFVVKCNHGCNFNILVKDKTSIDFNSVATRLGDWLLCKYGDYGYEFHYNLIKPRILIEPYLDGLEDIKFFVFNGRVKFIQVDKHFTENRLNFYSPSWEPLRWLSNKASPADYSILDNVPPNLQLMVNIAEKLAKPFKFVRVDLYSYFNKVLLGELTFTPGAGFQTYVGDGDLRVGRMLNL